MSPVSASHTLTQKTVLAACAAALVSVCAAAPAPAQERREAALGGGWTLIEQGALFGEDGSSVFARHQHGGTQFEIGCFRRQALNLIWTPADTHALPDTVTVEYRVNGALAGTQTQTVEAPQGRFWVSRLTRRPGPPGVVVDVLEAVLRAGAGEITLSAHEARSGGPAGPALVTDTVTFNNDDLGQISERILTACPLR